MELITSPVAANEEAVTRRELARARHAMRRLRLKDEPLRGSLVLRVTENPQVSRIPREILPSPGDVQRMCYCSPRSSAAESAPARVL